jgi:hypothetical protein
MKVATLRLLTTRNIYLIRVVPFIVLATLHSYLFPLEVMPGSESEVNSCSSKCTQECALVR